MTPRACAPPLLLAVDDEPGVHALARRFAESEGFDVITRPGGPHFISMTALALLGYREFDLPFNVVSGDAEIAVRILKARAHDFVTTASATGLPNVWISSCDQKTKM